MLDGPARILDSAGAYRIPQKVWKLHVGRSGAHSGSCRSIQNPAKRVETACWTVRRAFWILPAEMADEWILDSGFWILLAEMADEWIQDFSFWILDSAFCILDSASGDGR